MFSRNAGHRSSDNQMHAYLATPWFEALERRCLCFPGTAGHLFRSTEASALLAPTPFGRSGTSSCVNLRLGERLHEEASHALNPRYVGLPAPLAFLVTLEVRSTLSFRRCASKCQQNRPPRTPTCDRIPKPEPQPHMLGAPHRREGAKNSRTRDACMFPWRPYCLMFKLAALMSSRVAHRRVRVICGKRSWDTIGAH